MINNLLFYQEVIEDNSCPNCTGYLNIISRNGKVYHICFSCGYEQEVKLDAAEGRKRDEPE